MITSTILEDSDGQLLLDLSDIINQVGWAEDTVLEWDVTEEAVFIREANDTSRNL